MLEAEVRMLSHRSQTFQQMYFSATLTAHGWTITVSTSLPKNRFTNKFCSISVELKRCPMNLPMSSPVYQVELKPLPNYDIIMVLTLDSIIFCSRRRTEPINFLSKRSDWFNSQCLNQNKFSSSFAEKGPLKWYLRIFTTSYSVHLIMLSVKSSNHRLFFYDVKYL